MTEYEKLLNRAVTDARQRLDVVTDDLVAGDPNQPHLQVSIQTIQSVEINATHSGDIALSLEHLRRIAMNRTFLPDGASAPDHDRRKRLSQFSTHLANHTHEIVAHPDYQPPKKYWQAVANASRHMPGHALAMVVNPDYKKPTHQ
jgi:hypothetical protein